MLQEDFHVSSAWEEYQCYLLLVSNGREGLQLVAVSKKQSYVQKWGELSLGSNPIQLSSTNASMSLGRICIKWWGRHGGPLQLREHFFLSSQLYQGWKLRKDCTVNEAKKNSG